MKARRVRALALALLFDLILGDPPNRYHPVAWMGTAIAAVRQRAPERGPLLKFLFGAMLVAGGGATMAGLGYLLERACTRLPGAWGWLAEAGLLKLTFSVRGLAHAAGEVEAALAAGALPEARRRLSWHLVSRDTTTLNASQVAAATVESVAENMSDGLVAPLLYYAWGGLPGALAYRFTNTADSMLGYRDAAHEWLGKAPARLDDLANLLPARISAGLMVLGAALLGEDAGRAWGIWRRDAGRTASPNAGHPMSAMAGALGVELEKVGHYRLGVGGRPPAPEDIRRALHVMRAAVALFVALLALLPSTSAKK